MTPDDRFRLRDIKNTPIRRSLIFPFDETGRPVLKDGRLVLDALESEEWNEIHTEETGD